MSRQPQKAEPALALHRWGDAVHESTRTRRLAGVTCAASIAEFHELVQERDMRLAQPKFGNDFRASDAKMLNELSRYACELLPARRTSLFDRDFVVRVQDGPVLAWATL